MIYAYLRVSTNDQDVENQKFGIESYVKQKFPEYTTEYISDNVSGKVDWRKRKLGALANRLQKGDVIIFAEISRMARSILQVLEILREFSDKGVDVHFVKSNMVVDKSIQSKMLVTMHGLMAEIERELISTRTKEALAKRKSDGHKLGRPFGSFSKALKADQHREKIISYLEGGVSITDISKLIGISRAALYEWLKKNNLWSKDEEIPFQHSTSKKS